jgi:peroxiredoxin family protein
MAEGKTPLILVVLAGSFERVHYALATAAAAAAADRPTTLFFAQGAVRAIVKNAGWRRLPVTDPSLGGNDAAALDKAWQARGVARFEELLTACKELRVTFLVCSMGLRVADVTSAELRADLAIGETGLVDVLSRPGTLSFI